MSLLLASPLVYNCALQSWNQWVIRFVKEAPNTLRKMLKAQDIVDCSGVSWGPSAFVARQLVFCGRSNSRVISAFASSWMLCVLCSHQKRVFETVRNINQVVKQRSLTPSPMNIPGSNQSSAMNSLLSSCVSTPRSSFYGSDVGNVVLDNKTNSIILETEAADLGWVSWEVYLSVLGRREVVWVEPQAH